MDENGEDEEVRPKRNCVTTRSRAVLGMAPHELRVEGKFRGKEFGLAAVDGERGGAEQVLKGPAGGEVEADAAGGLAHASAEFEQACAQGFDLRRAPGLWQLQTE